MYVYIIVRQNFSNKKKYFNFSELKLWLSPKVIFCIQKVIAIYAQNKDLLGKIQNIYIYTIFNNTKFDMSTWSFPKTLARQQSFAISEKTLAETIHYILLYAKETPFMDFLLNSHKLILYHAQIR